MVSLSAKLKSLLVITLLAVTGLTHRQAYKNVFVITLTNTVAVFVAIAACYLTWIY